MTSGMPPIWRGYIAPANWLPSASRARPTNGTATSSATAKPFQREVLKSRHYILIFLARCGFVFRDGTNWPPFERLVYTMVRNCSGFMKPFPHVLS